MSPASSPVSNPGVAGDRPSCGPGADTAGDYWVFGYGSLMWRPGFPYLDAHSALLRGYHRSFCIYSHHHRGTPETPGLVLGLARGGACRGVGFRVARCEAAAVRAYLDERELVTRAYVPRTVPLRIGDARVQAHTYVVDPTHPQFAGDLEIDTAAGIIIEAEGVNGLNRDYLINTVRKLESEGFVDHRLHDLLRRVEHMTGILEAGGGI